MEQMQAFVLLFILEVVSPRLTLKSCLPAFTSGVLGLRTPACDGWVDAGTSCMLGTQLTDCTASPARDNYF